MRNDELSVMLSNQRHLRHQAVEIKFGYLRWWLTAVVAEYASTASRLVEADGPKHGVSQHTGWDSVLAHTKARSLWRTCFSMHLKKTGILRSYHRWRLTMPCRWLCLNLAALKDQRVPWSSSVLFLMTNSRISGCLWHATGHTWKPCVHYHGLICNNIAYNFIYIAFWILSTMPIPNTNPTKVTGLLIIRGESD